MSDYIKREDAIQAIVGHLVPKQYDGDLVNAGFGVAHEVVDAIPSADVMPVRHGRWIKSKAGGVLCSECCSYAPDVEKGSFTTRRIEQEKSAYCPNCGARMDGGNDE